MQDQASWHIWSGTAVTMMNLDHEASTYVIGLCVYINVYTVNREMFEVN